MLSFILICQIRTTVNLFTRNMFSQSLVLRLDIVGFKFSLLSKPTWTTLVEYINIKGSYNEQLLDEQQDWTVFLAIVD